MTESLDGQSVVVLGGSAGIGLAVARHALEAGAAVTITGRDSERLGAALGELPGARGQAFDAGDPAALTGFFAGLDRPVDHVFVSAGGPYYGRLADLDPEQAGRAIGKSLELMIRLAQLVPPLSRPGGSITLMSGTGSKHPAPGLTVIGATVASRAAAAANLALEIGPVRMNLIAAGFVDTPLSARLLGDGLDDRRRQLRETLPVHRVIEASDVADLALHLMTNTAITGVVYDLDGGQQLLPAVEA
ncbi:SDR family oxidoreductase [Herbiconiux ginsengi]|uniref:NAD(P)-dependent dehydrogenase, short-chain alcohol dehydrogenase family n=1 Tax=Herbiconiux ginsengi TaxID=381665 RepID=A0A1H3Q218_9MICO|nr:SDR family oxidoreductase [Herbiconiux ginsengi]SDZ06789.1 NAD(P)-dependent dehydrogenase, short-chain alcohol dehydrogenase family [Herbiconiux ginsengi]